MKKMELLIIQIVILMMACLPLHGEQLILKNGDKISGVVEFLDSAVSIKPKYYQLITFIN